MVHLVGFIIRIYHDARSSECQVRRGWKRTEHIHLWNLLTILL